MSDLAAYERAVVAAVHTGTGLAGSDVVRWAVHHWAVTSLAQVCPLTAVLLADRGRWEEEVRAELARPDRPAGLHDGGRQLLERLQADADPVVAAVAGVDAAALEGLRRLPADVRGG